MTSPHWRILPLRKETTRRFGDRSGPIRLHVNESPIGPPPEVLADIFEAVSLGNRYAFELNRELATRLAQELHLQAEQVLISHGSNELIDRIITALSPPGAEIIYPHPSYPIFRSTIESSGARGIAVDLDATGANDLEAMAAAVNSRTSLLILCDPNNPTGVALPPAKVVDFAASLPSACTLLVDQAYVEFGPQKTTSELPECTVLTAHENTLVTRTFSKYFGMAGLRIGYGASLGSELIEVLRDALNSSWMSRVSLTAALSALKYRQEYEKRLVETVSERQWIISALSELDLEPLESCTNFVICKESDPGVADRLADKGVLIRSGQSILMPGWLRITVGTHAENTTMISELARISSAAEKSH